MKDVDPTRSTEQRPSPAGRSLDGAGLSIRWPLGWLRNRYFGELTLVAAVYLFYISVKQLLVEDIEVVAFQNARRIIDLEISLHLFWELDIQLWLIEHFHWLVVFFNWTYSVAFFPILVPAAILLFPFRYRSYVHYRNIFLISFVITWILYLTVPTAPPRLMPEYGFTDTIEILGPALYNNRAVLDFYNQFSAMPSMHFGWTLLFGTFFITTRYRMLKLFGIVYPGLSLAAIVVTANHYLLDAIAGGIIILASFGIYVMLKGIAHALVNQRMVLNRPSPHIKLPGPKHAALE